MTLKQPKVVFYLCLLLALFSAPSYAGKEDIQLLIAANEASADPIFIEDGQIDIKDGDAWVAIIKTADGYVTKQTHLSVKPFKDESPDPISGKLIYTPAHTVFLLKGIPIKNNIKISPYTFHQNRPSKNESAVEIKNEDRTITLIRRDYKAPKDLDFTGTLTQFFMKINNREIPVTEPMRSHQFYPLHLKNGFPYIRWAGDLNGDGYPEVITSTSGEYTNYDTRGIYNSLLLSEVHDHHVRYRKIADYDFSFDR